MYTNPLHYDSVDWRHVWLPRQHEALEQAVAEQAVQHVETSLCGEVDAVSHGEQRDTLVRVREYEVPDLVGFLACVETCSECATRAAERLGITEALHERPSAEPLRPPPSVRQEQHEAAAGALYEARHPQGEGPEDTDEQARDVEDAIRYAVESAAEVAERRAKEQCPSLHPNCRCGTVRVDNDLASAADVRGAGRQALEAGQVQHEVNVTVEGEAAERLAGWMRDRAAEDSR